MPYLIFAIDYPAMDEKRESIRQEHRQYLKSFGDKILASGALLDDDKLTVIGGITLLDVESREDATLFEQEDPYAKAGIRDVVQIIYWRNRWWSGEFLLDKEIDV